MFSPTVGGYTLAGVCSLPGTDGVLLGDLLHNRVYRDGPRHVPEAGAWYVWVKEVAHPQQRVLDIVVYHGSVEYALDWKPVQPTELRAIRSNTLGMVSAGAYAVQGQWLHSVAQWTQRCNTITEGIPLVVSPYGFFVGHAIAFYHLAWGTQKASGLVCGARLCVVCEK